MDDTVGAVPEALVRLEQRVRRGMQQSYGLLAEQGLDVFRAEADVVALIELLVAKGVISADELAERRADVEQRIAAERADRGTTPVLEEEREVDPVTLDCAALSSSCHGACCRFYQVPLTATEVTGGAMLWDLALPYTLPRTADGSCAYLDPDSLRCTVWATRPQVCRGYSCKDDRAIWEDFATLVPTDRVRALRRSSR
jgi:uncharacterized protein